MAKTRSFEQLATLNKTVHEPARLAILSALHACSSADFKFLQSLTGLTQGNLSVHLTKLEESGLIEKEKTFEGNYPLTSVRLTDDGRNAIARHWKQLDDLRRAAMRLRTSLSPS